MRIWQWQFPQKNKREMIRLFVGFNGRQRDNGYIDAAATQNY